MKEFDINQDELKVLETPVESTDLEKEQYYLSALSNDEWGYNKALSVFVFKVENQIYYAKPKLIQFRCCGQPPAELIGCVLEKVSDTETRIIQKDMSTMPFTIKDDMALMQYCFANLF